MLMTPSPPARFPSGCAIALAVIELLLAGSLRPAAAAVLCSEASLDTAIAAGGEHFVEVCSPIGSGSLTIGSEKVITLDTKLEYPGTDELAPIHSASVGDRIFHVLPGVTLVLHNMRLEGGSSTGFGGSILNEGTLILRGSTITGASSDTGGGAIANFGTLIIENSTIESSTATGRGGGVYLATGSIATITRSTITGNTVLPLVTGEADGGGLYNAGQLTLENATISLNTAARHGGGLANDSPSAILRFVTITDNAATTGVGSAIAGSIAPTLEASIVVGDCGLALASGGDNLGSPGTGCGLLAPSDMPNVSKTALALGTLGNHGGRTETYRLGPASIALDAVDSTPCPASDQRGATRPDIARSIACDIGAYEETGVGLDQIALRVARGDPDPRGASTFEQLEGLAFSNEDIAFVALDSLGERSLYLWDGTAIEHIAGDATPVPGGVGSFDFRRTGAFVIDPTYMVADGGDFGLFYAADRVPNPSPPPNMIDSPDTGFYLFSAGQGISRCIGAGDVLPDGEIYPPRQHYPTFDIHGGSMLVPGVALYSCDGSGIDVVMPHERTLPNGDVIRREAFEIGFLRMDADDIFWSGRRHLAVFGGPMRGTVIDEGIYTYDPLTDVSTLVSERRVGGGPGTDAQSVSGGLLFANMGVTSLAGAVTGGVGIDTGSSFFDMGPAQSLLRSATVTNSAVFTSATARILPSISSIPAECQAESTTSIRSTVGGVLETHLEVGDTLDGKTVTCLLGGRNFAENRDIAFVAYFDDGTQGIYTATVPEPSLVVSIATGTMLAVSLRRPRRRRPERLKPARPPAAPVAPVGPAQKPGRRAAECS